MRQLTERDKKNLSRELVKPYVGYYEKCGIAKALEIMGYITETTYLVLADNFEMMEFERIPVGERTIYNILTLGR